MHGCFCTSSAGFRRHGDAHRFLTEFPTKYPYLPSKWIELRDFWTHHTRDAPSGSQASSTGHATCRNRWFRRVDAKVCPFMLRQRGTPVEVTISWGGYCVTSLAWAWALRGYSNLVSSSIQGNHLKYCQKHSGKTPEESMSIQVTWPEMPKVPTRWVNCLFNVFRVIALKTVLVTSFFIEIKLLFVHFKL